MNFQILNLIYKSTLIINKILHKRIIIGYNAIYIL